MRLASRRKNSAGLMSNVWYQKWNFLSTESPLLCFKNLPPTTYSNISNIFSFQATLHSRSDGDGKCTVNSRQSQTSQTDLSVIEEEDVELGAAEVQRSTIDTQTSQSPSNFAREVPCSHYVVDMSIPRRDYVINYNSNSRHDPPPPYTE